MNWSQHARKMQKEAYVFYFAFKHPRTQWYAKLVAACTAGYLLSPIQFVPSFIPVIGLLDDVLVLFLGIKVLQRITPRDVLAECRELADADEMRRKKEIQSSTPVIVAWVIMAFLGLLTTAALSAVVASYIYR